MKKLSLALLVALLLAGCTSGNPAAPPTPPAPPASLVAATDASPTQAPSPSASATPRPQPTPLPTRDPAWPSIFGAEVWASQGGAVATAAQDARISWMRYNGILWSKVEATQGTLDWATLELEEADLRALAAVGLTPIVIVREAPEWAQAVPGARCGPIREEALDDFAAFMGQVVARYSQPPYNVRYWEIGNEPDVDPALLDVSTLVPFGCWGDAKEPLYGGRYYAEMLKRIYPAIKEADPTAQVVIGGLLLDCDPTHPPQGKDCQPARFLEGILQNGGAAAFDVVAYHAYPLWEANKGDLDLLQPAWEPRGGALLGKLDFIRETMGKYGVDKPIMMNEGGLLCHEANPACPGEAFHDAQASHLVRLYARGWAKGLLGIVWYTLNGPGWREGGLLDGAGQPRPAYQSLRFMTGLLDGARYVKPLSDGALEGYQFASEGRRYELYWTTDGSPVALPLPDGATVYNKVGATLAVTGTLEIGGEPLFVAIEE